MFRFFKHPNNVCMSYREHMNFSLGLSKDLFVGSVQAFVHAIYPDVFVTSTTDLLDNLQKRTKTVGCRKIELKDE